MGLERGPLSLVSTTEELLKRRMSDSDLENREYGRGNLLRCPRDTLYPQKLALTSPTSCCLPVGIIRSRIQTTEIVCYIGMQTITNGLDQIIFQVCHLTTLSVTRLRGVTTGGWMTWGSLWKELAAKIEVHRQNLIRSTLFTTNPT
jgi:hypothetical protein